MTNGQRKTVPQRAARMLRELEGPSPGDSTSGFGGDASVAGALSVRNRATKGNGRRLIIRVSVVAGAAIVTVLTAMQARAPVGDDTQAAARAGPAAQHLTDARHAAQPARAAGNAKAE
jgi:hypothetical protein